MRHVDYTNRTKPLRVVLIILLIFGLCVGAAQGYLKTTTTTGSDYVDTFTNVSGVSGNETWTAPGATTIRVLVVGAGAGSGTDNGGGGAGGMVIDNNTYYVTGGTSYPISVGDGGLGAVSGSVNGQNGQASRFGELKTNTSGAGGSNTNDGSAGDNGGGAATTGVGGTGNTGFRGGYGSPTGGVGNRAGGGGGTSYAKGFNGSVDAGGNGQTGVASTITGSSVTYGGSGGGGTETGNTPGTGGAGGGGAGGGQLAAGTAGTPNTGGGAGGSGNGYATGVKGGSGIVIVRYPQAIAPIASFTTNTTTGIAPTAVKFTDTSTNSPTSWSYGAQNITPGNNTWIQVATTQNPEVIFGVGNWRLNLTATNTAGSNISTQITWANVTAAPIALIADFVGNVTSGYTGTCVYFTDLSTGPPTGWNWTFGDGNTSTSQNPTHCYEVVGNFSVSLNVSRSA